MSEEPLHNLHQAGAWLMRAALIGPSCKPSRAERRGNNVQRCEDFVCKPMSMPGRDCPICAIFGRQRQVNELCRSIARSVIDSGW